MVARHKVDKQPHDGEGGFKGRARKHKMLLLSVCVWRGKVLGKMCLRRHGRKRKVMVF